MTRDRSLFGRSDPTTATVVASAILVAVLLGLPGCAKWAILRDTAETQPFAPTGGPAESAASTSDIGGLPWNRGVRVRHAWTWRGGSATSEAIVDECVEHLKRERMWNEPFSSPTEEPWPNARHRDGSPGWFWFDHYDTIVCVQPIVVVRVSRPLTVRDLDLVLKRESDQSVHVLLPMGFLYGTRIDLPDGYSWSVYSPDLGQNLNARAGVDVGWGTLLIEESGGALVVSARRR